MNGHSCFYRLVRLGAPTPLQHQVGSYLLDSIQVSFRMWTTIMLRVSKVVMKVSLRGLRVENL